MNNNVCILMVRLDETKVVDHFITVDCDKKLIIDGNEDYPIELTMEKLLLCGGKETSNLMIAEFQELVKKDNTNHKNCVNWY